MPQTRDDDLLRAGQSKIPTILGRECLLEFTAVRIPGKVVWFNFELARESGLDVPSSNVMTPELHSRLVHMFSLRVLRPGEKLGNREPVLMYADKYGGSDILPCLGAGRAGFLSCGNFYLKGIGHTPLYKPSDFDDFQHTHGGLPMRESMFEAVFGEVNTNLLTNGSARILAIVDQGDYTVYPDGKREPRAVAVRAGSQLRPAHLFAKGLKANPCRLELFLRMAGSTGQLVTRQTHSRTIVPDLNATMLRIVEDHAITAAELFRWRMLHGAISMSNMELSGAMLDTTTQSAQPRTAPMKILTYHSDINIVYGKEHLQRAEELQIMYRSIVRGLPQEQRVVLNAQPIDFIAEMNRSFEKRLQLQMLKATGLKMKAAQRLQTDYPEIACRLKRVLTEMAALRNPGSINANKAPVEHISVLDVFNLLREYPALCFTRSTASPEPAIREYLHPGFSGNRRRQQKMRSAVDTLIMEFRQVYADLITAGLHIAPEYYGNSAGMRRSITSRANFENRPLDRLYRWNILREFKDVVDLYKSTDDSEIISRFISETVSESRRNSDA